ILTGTGWKLLIEKSKQQIRVLETVHAQYLAIMALSRSLNMFLLLFLIQKDSLKGLHLEEWDLIGDLWIDLIAQRLCLSFTTFILFFQKCLEPMFLGRLAVIMFPLRCISS
ncbi:hypothetical protein ACJX0J_008378, partial [Zea mays]